MPLEPELREQLEEDLAQHPLLLANPEAHRCEVLRAFLLTPQTTGSGLMEQSGGADKLFIPYTVDALRVP